MIQRVAQQGFTLIEVLAAMILGSLVLVMVFSMIDVQMSQQAEMDEVVKRRNSGSKIVAYLKKDLQGMIEIDSLDDITTSLEVVKDPQENTVLNYVSMGRQSVNDEGLVAPYNEVGYALKESKVNSNVLAFYRRHDFFIDDEPFRGGQYELLTEGVLSFKIEFANVETQWTEEWTQGFPTKMRLTLELLTDKGLENINDLPVNSEDWVTEGYAEQFIEYIFLKE